MFIEETENLIKAVPDLKDATVNPPDLEWSRLRCFLLFKDEDPTKSGHVRVRVWCLANLQELWYGMDKERSRAASRLAIPQLLKEINVLREPGTAEQRFRFMILNPGLFRTLMMEPEDDHEEPLEQYFGRILYVADGEGGGAGS